MSLKKLTGMAAVIALTVLLSACNIGTTPAPTQDVGLIYTQAAQLVATQFAMQQTQTALAIPPTALPSPTALAVPTFPAATPFEAGTPFGGSTPFGASTPFGVATQPGGFVPTATLMVFSSPVPTPSCNVAIFDGETVPDGTVFKPGEDFVKSFSVRNGGTCTWDDGYAFVYQGGTLDGYTIKIKNFDEFVKPGQAITFKLNLTASLVPNKYTDCWKMQDDRKNYFGDYFCVVIEVKK